MPALPITIQGLHVAYVAGAVANQIATILADTSYEPAALSRDLQANVTLLEECRAAINAGGQPLDDDINERFDMAVRTAEAKIAWIEGTDR